MMNQLGNYVEMVCKQILTKARLGTTDVLLSAAVLESISETRGGKCSGESV